MNWSEQTDEIINRAIVEQVMGECWHDWPTGGLLACKKCSVDWTYEQNPGYCTDLNAAARAEAKALTVVSYEDYIAELTRTAPYRGFCANAKARCLAVLKALDITEKQGES